MNKIIEDDYSTIITKDNIDTWNCIVYGYVIQGMLKENPELKYGNAMTKAEKLTNLLFNALKFKMTCGIK